MVIWTFGAFNLHHWAIFNCNLDFFTELHTHKHTLTATFWGAQQLGQEWNSHMNRTSRCRWCFQSWEQETMTSAFLSQWQWNNETGVAMTMTTDWNMTRILVSVIDVDNSVIFVPWGELHLGKNTTSASGCSNTFNCPVVCLIMTISISFTVVIGFFPTKNCGVVDGIFDGLFGLFWLSLCTFLMLGF